MKKMKIARWLLFSKGLRKVAKMKHKKRVLTLLLALWRIYKR
ncbi:MAG: hypothetical protein Q4E76_03890 [Tissierellia bacterium]|nr:hypothetical protein [Tissierellia bacterium]